MDTNDLKKVVNDLIGEIIPKSVISQIKRIAVSRFAVARPAPRRFGATWFGLF